jgi:ABC-type polysaccharide/polyol phosphate export permease
MTSYYSASGKDDSTVIDLKSRGNLRLLVITASEDLLHGLRRYDLWGRIGFLEIKRRYRRTTIGPFWSTISLAVFTAVMSSVGVGLWKQDPTEYMPFLASGMMVWLMLSTMITEGCNMFIASQHLNRMRMDYSILAYALVWRNLVGFFHNLVVYLLIVGIFLTKLITPSIFLVIPGLFLVALNAVWVALLLGMICVRFRDVQQLITTILQISLFATPVFWPPQLLTGITRLIFVDLNPLFSFMNVVREPLLGNTPALSSYLMILVVTLVGWTVTFRLFARYRKRIAFWV